MKRLLTLVLVLFIMSGFCFADAKDKAIKKDISTVINEFGVDKDSLAISIKNADNGKQIYSLNDKMLMNPASVQKVLTTPVVVETLGEDYEFATEIYSRGDEAIIKLGADPYLNSKILRTLVGKLSKDTTRMYIEANAIDNKVWGEGWQWDDDMNVLMPRFSSYNLDGNLIKLTIVPTDDTPFAMILNPSKYPLVFFNNVVKGEKTALDIHRDSIVSANTLVLSGTVARTTTVYIPTADLRRYFNVQLTRILEDKNLYFKHSVAESNVKDSDVLVERITHPIGQAVNDVLKNSNNLVSETMFKLAGGKYCNLKTGSDSAGIKMFNDYCVKNKLDNSRIRIADASGVSKNNLVSADFISEFLLVNKNNKVMESLPIPGEGTLANRLLPIKNNLKAKTGTLSDISSIAGYLTTKAGKKLVFCIMINDMKLSASDKKMLEDYILREAYLSL